METQPHVLIVEDEKKLASLLADYLSLSNFQTTCLHDGSSVEPWLEENDIDVILLDLMLPGKSGVDICKAIRTNSQVPILMVTAKVEEVDRLIGLEIGADDYICKPFSPKEVVARVKAVLRRTNPHTASALPFKLDNHRLVMSIGQQSIALTTVE
ncbi:MAG: response regulator, partial [Paraglaciecola sp.]|uniref:response regulator n=1 Tax=Paraglaciecola sp. TaxID=1920173 RepID=UPI003299A143